MHDGGNNDVASTRLASLGQRVSTTGNRDSMSVRVHVLPDDMVFAADEHARGAVETVRLGVLATGHCSCQHLAKRSWTWRPRLALDQQVCSSVCGLAPFPHDVVQTQIQLVER